MIGGELVREARKRAGITQAELAMRAKTTQSAIARLESGRTSPAFEQVEWLMRLCGFQLIISISPYDDQDAWQASQILRIPTIEARGDHVAAAVAAVTEARKAFDDSAVSA